MGAGWLPKENMDLSGPNGETSMAGFESTEGAIPDKRANMWSRELLASNVCEDSSILEGGSVAAEGGGTGFTSS